MEAPTGTDDGAKLAQPATSSAGMNAAAASLYGVRMTDLQNETHLARPLFRAGRRAIY
jgi:hypothetical protein